MVKQSPKKTTSKPTTQEKKKRSFPIKKILLIVFGSLFGFIALVIISGLLFSYIQKPVFVNKNLALENKLKIPEILQPRMENGDKVFDLSLQNGEAALLPGKKTATFGANGSYLGPTIRAHTGDKVRMNVTNGLNEDTTVHWHGMHLPPEMDGGPHQVIKKAANWQPYWTVTNEAAPLWYHPHLMGKTGEQVYQGLAGMFIIDDANSDSLALPKDYGVNDLPLIVQDRKFDSNNQFVYEPHHKDVLGHTGMHGDKILVNGTYAPYTDVPASQIRLRLLNASNARRYNFGFSDNRVFYQIATDGGLLETPVPLTRLILAPGERAEIVVDLSKQTKPVTLISDAVHEDNRVLRFVRTILRAERDENQYFKILELRPQATNIAAAKLPEKLNTIAKLRPADAVKTRKFVLDPGSQTINGKKMDSSVINEIVHSGDVEIWEFSNRSGVFHPMHVHGVQFRILSRQGKPPDANERGWKDTVHVKNGENVRVLVRFPEFSDPNTPYMYHCHILEHEDAGMMGQFVVVSKDTPNKDIVVPAMPMEAMPMH